METVDIIVERKRNDEGQLILEEYRQEGQLHNPFGPAVRAWNDEGQLINQEFWLDGVRQPDAPPPSGTS